jgi:L-threonylcarbamoyladenylate synthase
MHITDENIQVIVNSINNGQIGVIPSDTLYGISCSAFNKEEVERIYTVKGRDAKKPFIILISEISDLAKFNIKIDPQQNVLANKLWPNKLSIVFPCPDEKYTYLHRGTKSIAFRIPNNSSLLEILKETGPIVSTSVNTAGKEPALTIEEAKSMFGKQIDFYVDVGELKAKPTTVVSFQKGKVEILRQGDFLVDPQMLEY